jgi:hypothetical protein
MGYSGRYHAASLAAVFIALAIGILIGIGLADDVVSSASEELEASLRSDLSAAQDRADGLETELDQGRRFSDQVVPALLAGRLEGQRVALIEFGDVGDEIAVDARDAVDSAGGDLTSVAQVAQPPDLTALADALPPRFVPIRRGSDALSNLGREIGTELVGGGPLVEALKPELFDTFTGDLRGVDRVIVARDPAMDLDPAQKEATSTFEDALLQGIVETATASVGVELTSTDPTTLQPFIDSGMATVDHLDLPAGEVSLVYALGGIDGNFGVKDDAGSYLPPFNRSATVSITTTP